MYKLILSCVFLFLANDSSANELSNVINIGVINSHGGVEVMSVTKSDLTNDNILLCSKVKIKCYHLPGSKFGKTTLDENASDIASGKEVTSYVYNGNDLEGVTDKLSQVLIYPAEMEGNIQAKLLKSANDMLVIIDNKRVEVKSCSSSEGVHIYSPQFKAEMHMYYGLGYDVNSTCDESIYQ